MRGILGTPMARGNSEVIEAAVYTSLVVAGAAVSEDAAADAASQLTVKPFSADDGFAGFAVANDLNTKNATVSVVKVGLDLPVRVASGKTFVKGKGLFLGTDGKLVPEGDADAVYQLNGMIRQVSFTGLDNLGGEHSGVTVDLFGGGAPFTPDAGGA